MAWERTKRPGIYKASTPSGTRYKVYWRDAGGKQRTRTVRLWKDAEAFANGVGHRRATGELPDLERGKLTLGHLFEAVHEAQRYAAATLDLHAACLTRVGDLAERQLREITPEAVDAALEAIDRPSMRDKVRRVLASMLRSPSQAVDPRKPGATAQHLPHQGGPDAEAKGHGGGREALPDRVRDDGAPRGDPREVSGHCSN